jgi:adenylylsulfate kinase
VLAAAISPYRDTRDEVRKMLGKFIEVYVSASLPVCEDRDPKGLYAKVRAGELWNFTGIDDPYEPPLAPEIECNTAAETIDESRDKVIKAVLKSIR